MDIPHHIHLEFISFLQYFDGEKKTLIVCPMILPILTRGSDSIEINLPYKSCRKSFSINEVLFLFLSTIVEFHCIILSVLIWFDLFFFLLIHKWEIFRLKTSQRQIQQQQHQMTV